MDAYDALEIDSTVPQSKIKAAYHRLSLIFHPDKCTDKSDANLTRFLRIQEAWEAIGTEEKRREYDESSARAHVNVSHAEPILLEEMEECVDEDGKTMYSKSCRCGDEYNITMQDIADGYNTVQCNGCSLYVIVSGK
jgi:diphthamide biosynthesis protein 4